MILLAVVMTLASGCQVFRPKPPPALGVPDVEARVAHFSGTPLTGPRATAQPVATTQPAGASVVRGTWLALAGMPRDLAAPLGSRARLVIASRAGAPVRPSARLVRGTHVLGGADADALWDRLATAPAHRRTAVAGARGALLPGATVAFELTGPNGPADPITGRPAPLRIVVQLHRSEAGPVEVAVTIDGAAPADAPSPGAEAGDNTVAATADGDEADANVSTAPPGPLVPRRETAVMDWPVGPSGAAAGATTAPAGPDRLVLVLPSPFTDPGIDAIAVRFELAPAAVDDPATVELIAGAGAQVATATATAAAAPQGLAIAPAPWPGIESALGELAHPATRRPALVFLASHTGAPLAEDVALSADDATLGGLAEDVATGAADPSLARTADALGWLLDLTSLQLLAKLQADNQLPPELAAVLALHAGEAGRSPSSMEQVLPNLASREQLATRLEAENVIYLEDASPAARVRAFDWLRARGRAPNGYDPLGPLRDRRAALEAALEARAAEAAAAAAPQPPTTAPTALPTTRAGVP